MTKNKLLIQKICVPETFSTKFDGTNPRLSFINSPVKKPSGTIVTIILYVRNLHMLRNFKIIYNSISFQNNVRNIESRDWARLLRKSPVDAALSNDKFVTSKCTSLQSLDRDSVSEILRATA